MAIKSLQQRITYFSLLWGSIAALAIVILDIFGVLQPLEWWMYDVRSATCQYFTPAPSSDVVYLDIDDDALDAIHRWPWRRSMMAAVLDEVRRAGPKAVGIDVLFSEPETDRIERLPDDSLRTVSEDGALAEAIGKLGNVVLADSFSFTRSGGGDPLRAAAEQAFGSDLSMTSAELVELMGNLPGSLPELAVRVEADFSSIRRAAVHAAIQKLLAARMRPLNEVQAALLNSGPSTAPTTQPVNTTLLNIIAKEYQHVLSELSLRRFAIAAPATLAAPPPDAEFLATPLPQFSDAAAGAGYADYNVFAEPVVRAVPLLVRREGRLYPQFGLAMACRMLGADLGNVTLDSHALVIPSAQGEVRIPVRARYSSTSGRDVGYIMDIPWFGGSQWLTMYDWPEHRQIVQHYPIGLAWGIAEIRQRIATNNKTIDTSLSILTDAGLRDSKEQADYRALGLTEDDAARRGEVAGKLLAALEGLDDPQVIKDINSLPVNEQLTVRAFSALRGASGQNVALQIELQARRKELAEKLHGKGVLIGAVATAMGDFVTTPIHARCPGVIVHGVIVNAILNRDFLRTAPRLATILLTLLFGLLATGITSHLPALRAAVIVVGVAALYFAANGLLLFDRMNVIVSAAAPLVAIGFCWGTCMLVRMIVETVERIRLKRDAALIDHEISLARQVQAALIPKQLTILAKVESHGWTLAATTTGGDCFDLWKMADGRMGILVADASGHGLGPSIIVSEVRALVRALCDLYTEPQKLLERVNQRLAADLQGTKFCTAFVGFVNEDGTLSWGSAGHGPMLWAATPDGVPIELEGTGLPLGVSEDWFGDESVPPLQLGHGGWLSVFSDGIFEAPAPAGEQFGVDRVKQTINSHRTESCERIVDALRTAVHKWQVVEEPNDDQTVVFIRLLATAQEIPTDAAAG